jgi:hypothetical protein
MHHCRHGGNGSDLALGVDVRDIGSDTWCHADIIEGELGDPRVQLEQQRQWLTDTTGGTEDGDLGVLRGAIVSVCTFRPSE